MLHLQVLKSSSLLLEEKKENGLGELELGLRGLSTSHSFIDQRHTLFSLSLPFRSVKSESRIRPYLPRVQWTWQRTGAAFCNRFRGYYFDGGIQDQIRSAIANFDAGGDRLITSIDALGSRMAGQAIRQLEGQWRLMNDVGRH